MNENPHSSSVRKDVDGASSVASVVTDFAEKEEATAAVQPIVQQHTIEHRYVQQLSLINFLKALKTYVLASEDDLGLHLKPIEPQSYNIDTEAIPGKVNLHNIYSNTQTSDELANNEYSDWESVLKEFLDAGMTSDTEDAVPSTSKGILSNNNFNNAKIKSNDDELGVRIDESAVSLKYLLSKESLLRLRKSLIFKKKKISLLESIHKLETVLEDQQPSSTSIDASDSSLDYFLRMDSNLFLYFLNVSEEMSTTSSKTTEFRKAVHFLHANHTLLEAAEHGYHKRLEDLIRKGVNLNQVDALGRTALHLAVGEADERSIKLLLKAGADANIEDSVGMTPLSICLMRRPSVKIANLLFQHGAKLLPRTTPLDTGLFLQFIMMSRLTSEEEALIKLLVSKGALVNDPEAPGGRQALHFAAMGNNCQLIRLLYDLGADLHLTNHRNQTPLQVALAFKCRDAAECLEQLINKDLGDSK